MARPNSETECKTPGSIYFIIHSGAFLCGDMSKLNNSFVQV